MIKAFIFDFDGVILYTPGISRAAWKESFKKAGIDFTDDDYSRLQGIRTKDKIPMILKQHGKYSRSMEERILGFREKLKTDKITGMSNDEFRSIVVPGSLEFLKDVKSSGLRMALVTSNPEATAMKLLKRLGIAELFSVFVFGDHVKRGKPNPDTYLLAADKLGVEPESCLVFEDTVNGIKSAKGAGMRVIALNTNRNREKLAAENPERIINDFTGLSAESFTD